MTLSLSTDYFLIITYSFGNDYRTISMGQTPAVIVDSFAFNSSGPMGPVWDLLLQGYGGTSILLQSKVGNFSIKTDMDVHCLEDSSFPHWMLIGDINISQSSGCHITLGDIGGFTEPGLLAMAPSPADYIFDNIIWILELEEGTVNVGGDFTVNCSTIDMESPVFNYALLTPAPTVLLDKKLLFVNYTDNTIVLEGQWQDSLPGLNIGPGKSSAITGDTIKFPFTGWNVTFLGFFDPTTSGNITLGVSLDEQTQMQLDFNNDIPFTSSSARYFEYFTLVQQESDSGNHTITVEILEASLSQTVSFRGFTYIPGFATLNDMPDLSVSTSSSLASTSSPTLTPSGPSLGSGQSSHQELTGGAIAGVVVGAITGICLIGLILWAVWRRKKRRRSLLPAQAWVESTSATGMLHLLPPGSDNVTPSFEKRDISAAPPDHMHHLTVANAHDITPFTKSYITSSASGTAGDIGQDQEQPLQDSTVHLSLFPVELPRNGNNGPNGDQTTPPEQNRTDLLLLERLNNLMNAIQHPPAYEQEASP
ncbi:hypothetical protein BDP27DRAFT_1363376 [Rhodocollybia butyracea]|uniref:Peptidase A1 domain-containing protein n=1 Tax=Rhodocollybia butyracea TaxID=206335 RepID=A0A9P5PUH5_9AGAR|nr:hypothetical protein BDP27DRAFT_1363376 [Rhodocollybia butyracea]